MGFWFRVGFAFGEGDAASEGELRRTTAPLIAACTSAAISVPWSRQRTGNNGVERQRNPRNETKLLYSSTRG